MVTKTPHRTGLEKDMNGQETATPTPPEREAAGQSTSDPSKNGGDNSLAWLDSIPNGTILSYNLSEEERPGGMKVRWKVRVATGAEAARWDTRQAEAITEALQWLIRHPPPT
ncbi:MAG TPA: hypothetical protein VGS19_06725 [Streptosporangiaceae bacterium]|nr:hypothetical protein [Streptosporangiaceae bacterium]